MKKSPLSHLIVLVVALTPCLSAQGAGMQTQLDNIYSEMENYTEPGSFETMRRSGYTLGRYTMKSEIVNENLVSMTPPSARGGCAGIDVFGGSFSFVNSDQIITLLRQVASNAKGYAFQLAMDNMCPGCMKWMNELQSKVQSLNSNLSNSCQLAQGLVNDVSSITPWKSQEENAASLTATIEGVGEDFGDLTKFISDTATPSKRLKTADADKFNASTGNIVYKELKRQQVENWYAGGDEELIETIMSITGSVVISDLVTNPEDGGDTTEIRQLPGQKITLANLMDGIEDVAIYDCSLSDYPDICRIQSSDVKEITIVGLKQKILMAFTGTNGLITYIRDGNINGTFTAEQRSILAAMPHSIGAKIFQLAPISPEAAETLVQEAIDPIALEFCWRLISRSFKATLHALKEIKTGSYTAKAIEQVEASQTQLQQEHTDLASKMINISDVDNKYNAILQGLPKPNYVDMPAINNNAG